MYVQLSVLSSTTSRSTQWRHGISLDEFDFFFVSIEKIHGNPAYTLML